MFSIYWQYKALEFVTVQELGSDVNLYALVFGESVLNDAVCFYFFPLHARAVSTCTCELWLTYLSPCLERTDGNFSLQVCFRLWSDTKIFQATRFVLMYVLLFRTMSSVRSHAAAGANFFMMILQFLETFVGSMSSGWTSAPNSIATWLWILWNSVV